VKRPFWPIIIAVSIINIDEIVPGVVGNCKSYTIFTALKKNESR
jgi:hypothetical protein